MRRYELTFIVDPDISEENRGQIFERVKNLIDNENGFLVDFNEWGQKKLAYEIRKKTRGYYVCMDLCCPSSLIDELERTFRLDDKLLKYMTILLDNQVDLENVKAEMEIKKEEKEAKASDDDTEDVPETSEDDLDDVETTEPISEEEEM